MAAAVLSGVPALGAILGLVLLGETLGAATWGGILVLSLGILLTALRPRKASGLPKLRTKGSSGTLEV